MCNSRDNKELCIILHVILEFKGHLRLEYSSGFLYMGYLCQNKAALLI